MPHKVPLIDRLQKNLKVVPSGCWEWQGYCLNGYGHIGRGGKFGKTLLTHRVMWEIVFGPVPKGLCVLHKCDNPCCCCPTHLFLGTQKDNMADKVCKGRQSKLRGEENGRAKLTEDQVNAIRSDNRTQLIIGKEYGVHLQTVNRIKKSKLWKENIKHENR